MIYKFTTLTLTHMIAHQPAEAGPQEQASSLAQVAREWMQTPVELVQQVISGADRLLEEGRHNEGIRRCTAALEELISRSEEYLRARAEGSELVVRYTLLCAQACDSVASKCHEFATPEAVRLERFCRTCEKFLDREFRSRLENWREAPDRSAGMMMQNTEQ